MNFNGRFWLASLIGSTALTVAVVADSALAVDPAIAAYSKVDGIKGNINIIGSAPTVPLPVTPTGSLSQEAR